MPWQLDAMAGEEWEGWFGSDRALLAPEMSL